GILPYLRCRADADLGRLGDLVELLPGPVQREWTSRVLFRLSLYADPVRRYLQSFVKANQSASNRSGKNGRKARQCSRAAGVVGSIGDDPYSPARCVPAGPVRSTASHFGVNAPVMLTFQEQGEAHADNLRLHGLQADMRTFPDTATIPG